MIIIFNHCLINWINQVLSIYLEVVIRIYPKLGTFFTKKSLEKTGLTVANIFYCQ